MTAIQKDVYWENASVLGLEKLRLELRDIIKFLEKDSRPIVYTNYEDSFHDPAKEQIIIYGFNDLEAYKRKVQQYLLEHQSHITIHKLRMNIPVTKTELQELERMLFEQGELGTKENFIKAYGEQPLGKFIRSIVGLDANAAKMAFSELLQNQNFNTQQIRFIDTIINYFTVKGTVELLMLFQSPFTDINPSSVFGLFDETSTAKIRKIIDGVNYNANVA